MSFKIKSADGTDLQIKDGEYYFNTKDRCRAMIKDILSASARQTYACLELGTMGFQQEKAVMPLPGGGTRPMTPQDICTMSQKSKQNVRRDLAEIESVALGERRAVNGGSLTKGQIELYSWAVPRTPKEKNGSRARLPFPERFPTSWNAFKPLIRRLKIKLPIDLVVTRDYQEEGERIARDYQNAEMVAARFLNGFSAQPKSGRIYKVERTKEQRERTEATGPQPPLSSSGISLKESSPPKNGHRADKAGVSTENPDSKNKLKLTTTEPPEGQAVEYATPVDELVALMQQTTGRKPERKLVMAIKDVLETRSGTLPEYLEDIRPRLARLREPAREGFFLSHAKKWGGVNSQPAPDPQTKEQAAKKDKRCTECQGTGLIGDRFCACTMGRDLAKVERRKVKLQQIGAAG